MFGDLEIEKNKFYRFKNLVPLWNLDIEKFQYLRRLILVKKTINTLFVTCIMIIKLKLDNVKQAFAKSRDGQTKWMCFLIEDDELLEKYNTICDKASTDIKIDFDSDPVYNKRF